MYSEKLWQPGVTGGLLPTLTILSFQSHVESDSNPILPVPRGLGIPPVLPRLLWLRRLQSLCSCLDPKTDSLGLLCYFASAKWWVCLRKVDWILVIFLGPCKSERACILSLLFFF